MRAQVLKWGNSLAVRIPRAVAEEAKLKAGDALEIAAPEEGSVAIHAIGKVPTLAQLIAEITPENRYEEISTSSAVGKEIVEW
jgi:antitoxin MazE